jgi:hypothetical protein
MNNLKTILFWTVVLFSLPLATQKITSDSTATDTTVSDSTTTDTTAQDITARSTTISDTTMKRDTTVKDTTVKTPVQMLKKILKKQKGKETKPIIIPEVSVEQSDFVKFLKQSISLQKKSLVFEGEFVVLGKAIYGHFSFVSYDDSGTVVDETTTDDRAYRSDKGGKIKFITVNLGSPQNCTLVKTLFHETRAESEK